MAEPVIMPKQGQSVESCILSKWYKKKGDKVEKGDLLFSYETDKASFEEEASVSGILLDIFFEEGDDVPCFRNVCVIGQEGEPIEAFHPLQKDGDNSNPEDRSVGEQPAAEAGGSARGQAPGSVTGSGANTGLQGQEIYVVSEETGQNSESRISPRARNLAEKIGVDYRLASPSGPDGRIIEQDIIALRDSGHVFTLPAKDAHLGHGGSPDRLPQGTGLGGRITTEDLQRSLLQENDRRDSEFAAAAGSSGLKSVASSASEGTGAVPAQAPAAAESFAGPAFEEEKIPHIRKVIAKAMHQSLTSTAQLTLNASFDATVILDFRKELKETGERFGLSNITLNDMILFAVARTLPDYRNLNAHFLEDRMRYFKNVNLGVATDTDRGLMVPTIFGAERMSLNEISVQAKRLAADCRTGTINPDLLKNGSFTVTNLGTLGIESFTPILNPPQTGILGVNTIVQRVRESDNGEVEFYPAMGLSLTFDHRAVDGAPAARFLQELKRNLENFTILLTR